MQIAKPAILQSDYKKKKSLNSKEGQIRPVCDDKNSQSTKFIHMRSVTKPNNICFPNHQYNLVNRNICVVTRTVNLPDVTRRSIQQAQSVMTGTLNLLEVTRKSVQ